MTLPPPALPGFAGAPGSRSIRRARRALFGTAVLLLCWLPLVPLALTLTERLDGDEGFFTFIGFNGLGIYALGTGVEILANVLRDGAVGVLPAWVLLGLLAVLLLQLGSGFLIRRTHAAATGNGERPGAAFKAVLERTPAIARFTFVAAGSLAATNLFLLLASMVLSPLTGTPASFLFWPVALVLLGFFLARYWLTLPALVLEGLGCRAAMLRSDALTRGARSHAFLAVLLLLFLPFVFAFPPALAAALAAGRSAAVPVLAILLGGALTGAFRASILTHSYLARVRATGLPDVSRLTRVFD